MLKTIAQLNEWAEEANITEVSNWFGMDGSNTCELTIQCCVV